jgi:hypothetical protein
MDRLTRSERTALADLLEALEGSERISRAVAEMIAADVPYEVRARLDRSVANTGRAADALFKFIRDHE